MDGEICVDFSSYGKRKAHLWDCISQAKMWVYLVSNVEAWGDPVYASRRFNHGGI